MENNSHDMVDTAATLNSNSCNSFNCYTVELLFVLLSGASVLCSCHLRPFVLLHRHHHRPQSHLRRHHRHVR